MDDTETLKKVKIEDTNQKSTSIINKINFKIILPYIIGLIIICILLVLYIFGKNNSQHYDYLIVGSGLYGATFNYLAKKSGKKTLVIERRNTTGGNLYCENIEGIFVHKYGPHIFHTDNEKVWNFVNNLVDFYPFQNQPVTKAGYYIYSLPFNMWTFNQLWGVTTPEDAKKKN